MPDIEEISYQGLDMPAGFMINYHLYRNYWPLLAMGRYLRATNGPKKDQQIEQIFIKLRMFGAKRERELRDD